MWAEAQQWQSFFWTFSIYTHMNFYPWSVSPVLTEFCFVRHGTLLIIHSGCIDTSPLQKLNNFENLINCAHSLRFIRNDRWLFSQRTCCEITCEDRIRMNHMDARRFCWTWWKFEHKETNDMKEIQCASVPFTQNYHCL